MESEYPPRFEVRLAKVMSDPRGKARANANRGSNHNSHCPHKKWAGDDVKWLLYPVAETAGGVSWIITWILDEAV